jgi:hypothetical protein
VRHVVRRRHRRVGAGCAYRERRRAVLRAARHRLHQVAYRHRPDAWLHDAAERRLQQQLAPRRYRDAGDLHRQQDERLLPAFPRLAQPDPRGAVEVEAHRTGAGVARHVAGECCVGADVEQRLVADGVLGGHGLGLPA